MPEIPKYKPWLNHNLTTLVDEEVISANTNSNVEYEKDSNLAGCNLPRSLGCRYATRSECVRWTRAGFHVK
jgi:hypothetical protein